MSSPLHSCSLFSFLPLDNKYWPDMIQLKLVIKLDVWIQLKEFIPGQNHVITMRPMEEDLQPKYYLPTSIGSASQCFIVVYVLLFSGKPF